MKAKKNILMKPLSISQILRKSETSNEDLQKLCDKLGIQVKINWKSNYNKSLEDDPSIGQILNMGSKYTSGTHWVATYMNKYFDSFGLPPPPNLNHLEWTPLEIQDQNYGRCGQYCCLWLYFMMQGEEDQFYNIFNYE